MSSWLDNFSSPEIRRFKERFHMSEANYEKIREKVKGPEDLEKELAHNALLAELKFALDSEPAMKKALQDRVKEDIKESGLDAVLDDTSELTTDAKIAVVSGKFVLTISANATTHEDQIMVMPEGNVTDKLPVKPAFSEQYLSQFQKAV
ncbi:MAG: hypothetical protein WCG83_02465 [Candidatus Peregrinibacteria bacterium]